MVVVPIYELMAPNINLPEPVPSLVRLLNEVLVPLIADVTVIPPEPFTPKVIPPVLVKPAVPNVNKLAPSLFILDAVAVVIIPDKVVAPLVLGTHITPLLPIPVPLIVMYSGILNPDPTIFNAAPSDTVVL